MKAGDGCVPPTSSAGSRSHSWTPRSADMGWMLIGIAFVAWVVLVALFTPRIDYHVSMPLRPNSDEFLKVVEGVCQTTLVRGNGVEVLTNGTQFYPAIRDALLTAETSINLESYIFQ